MQAEDKKKKKKIEKSSLANDYSQNQSNRAKWNLNSDHTFQGIEDSDGNIMLKNLRITKGL